MNNKILVEVNVPVLEHKYNCFIPVGKTVSQVSELLVKGIFELSGGAYDNKFPVLYDSLGKEIKSDCLVKDSGISNGSKIIII